MILGKKKNTANGASRRTPKAERKRSARAWARWLPGLLVLLATAVQGAPPPPYVVSSLPDNERITIYSEYLPDPDGTLSLEAVTAGEFDGRFKPASRFVERLGLSDHPWWVRIAVQNELGDQRRFALMQGPRHYFDSEFFLPGDGGYHAAGPGERFVHRTPVYLVDLPPGEPRVFYWRVNPRGSLIYSINLSTLPAALGNDPLFAMYWLLFGVMLALAGYNGLVAVMRGGISHGYHAGFLLALAGLVLFSGRVMHAIGLSQSGGASFPRAIGVTLTWISYVFAGVALLFFAIA